MYQNTSLVQWIKVALTGRFAAAFVKNEHCFGLKMDKDYEPFSINQEIYDHLYATLKSSACARSAGCCSWNNGRKRRYAAISSDRRANQNLRSRLQKSNKRTLKPEQRLPFLMGRLVHLGQSKVEDNFSDQLLNRLTVERCQKNRSIDFLPCWDEMPQATWAKYAVMKRYAKLKASILCWAEH